MGWATLDNTSYLPIHLHISEWKKLYITNLCPHRLYSSYDKSLLDEKYQTQVKYNCISVCLTGRPIFNYISLIIQLQKQQISSYFNAAVNTWRHDSLKSIQIAAVNSSYIHPDIDTATKQDRYGICFISSQHLNLMFCSVPLIFQYYCLFHCLLLYILIDHIHDWMNVKVDCNIYIYIYIYIYIHDKYIHL